VLAGCESLAHLRHTGGGGLSPTGKTPKSNAFSGQWASKWAPNLAHRPMRYGAGIATTCRLAGRYVRGVAEGVGFEPTVRLPVQQFSRLPQSSTLPSLPAGYAHVLGICSRWLPTFLPILCPLRRGKQPFGEPLRCRLVDLRQDVTVNVVRDANTRMAEPFTGRLEVLSGGEHEASVRVRRVLSDGGRC
jgi:hypothetical protein